MKVVITHEAWQQIYAVVNYIDDVFSKKSADNFVKRLQKAQQLIGLNPYMCPIESCLNFSKQTYRSYVLDKINKLIYRISDDEVEIVLLWDCRRNPQTLVSKLH